MLARSKARWPARVASVPAPEALVVAVRQLDPDVPLPSYAYDGDAGADLVTTVTVTLGPGERVSVPTGIALALPAGYAGFVHPRSGLAARSGIGIVNAPGTVDSGYRGEILVQLVNHDLREAVTVQRGERIAQLVIQRVEQARFVAVETLPDSPRGSGGHGSSGR
jgi:dUTP pyrophosphatase